MKFYSIFKNKFPIPKVQNNFHLLIHTQENPKSYKLLENFTGNFLCNFLLKKTNKSRKMFEFCCREIFKFLIVGFNENLYELFLSEWMWEVSRETFNKARWGNQRNLSRNCRTLSKVSPTFPTIKLQKKTFIC